MEQFIGADMKIGKEELNEIINDYRKHEELGDFSPYYDTNWVEIIEDLLDSDTTLFDEYFEYLDEFYILDLSDWNDYHDCEELIVDKFNLPNDIGGRIFSKWCKLNRISTPWEQYDEDEDDEN
jgi:hypothetical protein